MSETETRPPQEHYRYLRNEAAWKTMAPGDSRGMLTCTGLKTFSSDSTASGLRSQWMHRKAAGRADRIDC